MFSGNSQIRIPFPLRSSRSVLVSLIVVLGVVPSRSTVAEPARAPSGMLTDAELHAVFFLDPDRGWAVGDRGVIWQTESGGREWRLTDSPTTARLRSISFIDSQTGWIAGGWIHGGTHRSSAVLLRSENGGKNWTRIEVPTLPAIRQIWFADPRHGWALGDCSAFHSTGWYRTQDGGFTWDSVPSPAPVGFVGGAWIDSGRAALLAGDASMWMISRDILAQTAPRSEFAARPRAVEFSNGRGWLVGDRGLVLRTEADRGARAPAIGKLPLGLADEFDWSTVAVRGESCWIAGSPGTRVLRTADGGRSWRTYRTGQSLPINRLFFLDDQHGWAVGPCGRILATRDGGQTWRSQQAAGERTALLAVHGSLQRIPLEVLARVAADEGYLATAMVIPGRFAAESKSALIEERFREACSAVGAMASPASLFQPALESPGGSVAGVPMVDGRAARTDRSQESLEALVIRQLRIWRPDVLLTDSLTADDSEEFPLAQFVLQAARRASDPAVFPGQLVLGGLEPWTVQRLYGAVPRGELAGVSYDTTRLSLPLGCSLAEFTVTAQELLTSQPAPAAATVGCRLIWSQESDNLTARDLFSGVTTARIGENRRPTFTPPAARIEGLVRSSQPLRNLQEIAARGVGGDGNVAGVMSQIDQLLRDHEPSTAGRLLYRMAQLFRAAGQYAAADACLATLIEKSPEHELTDAALLWLVRYRGSAELQHAFGNHQLTRLPDIATENSAAVSGVQPASFVQRPVPTLQPVASDGLLRTVHVVDFVRDTRPVLFADPRMQFPYASVTRRMGLIRRQLTGVNRSGAQSIAPVLAIDGASGVGRDSALTATARPSARAHAPSRFRSYSKIGRSDRN